MQLAGRRHRVCAMLERVETNGCTDLPVGKPQSAQVLDPIDSRTFTHVGADEPPPGEQRPQIVRLTFLDLHRAELDDRLGELEPGSEIGYDLEQDRARGYTIPDSGIVVVASNEQPVAQNSATATTTHAADGSA